MKAEAFCRTGRQEKSFPLFRQLVNDPDLGDQAAFRVGDMF